MRSIEEIVDLAESFSFRKDVVDEPSLALMVIEDLVKVVKEQKQELERIKEIAFADQTDYLIVGTLRQELSPSQTGDNVV